MKGSEKCPKIWNPLLQNNWFNGKYGAVIDSALKSVNINEVIVQVTQMMTKQKIISRLKLSSGTTTAHIYNKTNGKQRYGEYLPTKSASGHNSQQLTISEPPFYRKYHKH